MFVCGRRALQGLKRAVALQQGKIEKGELQTVVQSNTFGAYPMRAALLGAALVMIALPAVAQGCLADCLSGANLCFGNAANAWRICHTRCTAAARLDSAPEGRRFGPLLLMVGAIPSPPPKWGRWSWPP